MSSNVIPSAPEPSIYPQLPSHDFRMQKANEVEAALNAEVAHYRGVAKKYKRAKKIVNWSATGCGLFSAGLSTASLGTALSVVGLPAPIPLGSVGGAFALASSGLIVASKKLDSKIKNIAKLLTSQSLSVTQSADFIPKPYLTTKFLTASFSQSWLNFLSITC